MPNATEINNSFESSGRSYQVSSTAIRLVEFGSINLPSFPALPAALVTWSSGATYLYIGIPAEVLAEFEATCLRNVNNVGVNSSVGQYFNANIRQYPTYARIHQA